MNATCTRRRILPVRLEEASLPIEGTTSGIAALSDIRTRLVRVFVALDGPIAEAVRVREFETSLDDLPF
jgi:hypothetical protein